MQQMTAEDLEALNNLLEKYDMKGWSPAYISTKNHPCSLTLLPFELVGDEVVTLIKNVPDNNLDFPTYDGVKWIEGGAKTQAQIIAEIKDQQETLNKELKNSANKNVADDNASEALRNDVNQLSHSITVLTSLVSKQLGAGNDQTEPATSTEQTTSAEQTAPAEPAEPATSTTDSKEGDK